jgi:tRNA-specific 2-thiouridylase
MSGGVDSSAAMLLAMEKYGRDAVCGVTLCLSADHGADEKNCADAKDVCDRLGVPHVSVDARAQFENAVIDYFTAEYFRGRTPNPCVVCNREIKFGLLYDWAKEHGFDRIVTGHYAVIETADGTAYLRRAADARKDQSYVLAMLSQEQLAAADFPLGGMTKPEVRELASSHGFASASRSDSQDICFIPDGDYAAFLKDRCGITDQPGDYIDETGKILGKHKGQWQYTIGQRKGLGISMGKHVFVLDKDAEQNRVTLGDEDGLFRTRVTVTGLNFISGHTADPEKTYTAKLRYAHRPAVAKLTIDGNTAVLTFDEPQRAPTPGQFAVVYDGDTVVCAGVIA